MALTASKIQKIYGMGAKLGLVESGNKNDELHILVAGITGKGSVKQLTDEEYKAVISELAARITISQLEPPPEQRSKKRYESNPGRMTEGQQRKVWYLMYQLAACDTAPSTASLGERLSGIIRRELKIDATEKDPMRWIPYNQGNKLIEVLKGYICSARHRTERSG